MQGDPSAQAGALSELFPSPAGPQPPSGPPATPWQAIGHCPRGEPRAGGTKTSTSASTSRTEPWSLQHALGLPLPPGDQATYDAPCSSACPLAPGKHGCCTTAPAARQARLIHAQRGPRTGGGSGRLRCLWCRLCSSRIGCERIRTVTVGKLLLDADASSTSSKGP